MKQKLLPLIFLFISVFSFSQENEFYEMLRYPKVLINEDLVAYTVHFQETKNGVELEEQMNEPSINHPFNISIISKENNGLIRVDNGDSKDIIIDFSYIYKGPEEDGTTMYHFNTKDEMYSATYFLNRDFNDFLTLEFNRDKNNRMSITYTISEL
ncbi:hypothetical protein ML462_15400 [Gramella lutea]|uniref:Uncharacterized protein n=1 Tax=Christiangramia lutea TaxID=1607951 RepID=A0A9X1V8V6_9FLAO|nr:hypothetical protein [Christiangramia lutea]MCH4824558.1 hypothetical protein [Christiangramia lutea]